MKKNAGWLLASIVCCFIAVPGECKAQDNFPEREIRAYVGFAAGSGADIIARYFSRKLQEQAGRPVVVENKVGASGNIAMGVAAKSRPNGYTILFAPNATLAGSPLLLKNPPFDSTRDFVRPA